jgi:hypothetical protein
MTFPHTVVNSPRRWRIPSANAASVTAWLCPSSTLVCQPLTKRLLGADGAVVVGMTPLSPYPMLCGGEESDRRGRCSSGSYLRGDVASGVLQRGGPVAGLR